MIRSILVALVGVAVVASAHAQQPKSAPRIVAYFAEWGIYQRKWILAKA